MELLHEAVPIFFKNIACGGIIEATDHFGLGKLNVSDYSGC
jgi:hypothetical protein